jgi:hypothetical protein
MSALPTTLVHQAYFKNICASSSNISHTLFIHGVDDNNKSHSSHINDIGNNQACISHLADGISIHADNNQWNIATGVDDTAQIDHSHHHTVFIVALAIFCVFLYLFNIVGSSIISSSALDQSSSDGRNQKSVLPNVYSNIAFSSLFASLLGTSNHLLLAQS